MVGSDNANYLDQVTNLTNFDLQELSAPRSSFSTYADSMIQEYFWGKPILFYMYLDIAAAKGNEWPHYATAPHNIKWYRRTGLQPVWDYLSANSGNPITQKDILDAMNASTGHNHAGFFEFWESLGVTLDLNDLTDLASWDPGARSLEDSLPFDPAVVGALRTEHLLSGVPQPAVIHLDEPAPTNQIYVEYQYSKVGNYLNYAAATKVLQGENVSVVRHMEFSFKNIKETNVLFLVTTNDPARQDFPLTLTYPLDEGV